MHLLIDRSNGFAMGQQPPKIWTLRALHSHYQHEPGKMGAFPKEDLSFSLRDLVSKKESEANALSECGLMKGHEGRTDLKL